MDVFSLKEASVVLPQSNIGQILNAIAPSFTSTIQTNSDGTDHLDPAQLRGLGPDQVLVLVNGKEDIPLHWLTLTEHREEEL